MVLDVARLSETVGELVVEIVDTTTSIGDGGSIGPASITYPGGSVRTNSVGPAPTPIAAAVNPATAVIAGAAPAVTMPGREQRQLRQPGERSHRHPQLAQRDAQEGANDRRIELCSGTVGELLTGGGGWLGLLIRADRCHHVERVGNRDDSRRQADLGLSQPVRVSATVPAFVVFTHGLNPLTEPTRQRRRELGTDLGVGLDDLVLVGVQLAGLVEDLERNLELADVVQQRRPLQLVDLVLVQAEFVADHVGVGPHSLGVPPGSTVVQTQCGDQLQHMLGSLSRLVVSDRPVVLDPLFECSRPATA